MSYFRTLFPLTAFGDLRTAELHPQFQGSFEYTVDNTELFTKAITNGGTIVQSKAMCEVSTSTTTASKAMLTSRRHAKYKSGLGGLLRFTALFSSPVADTEQYIGLIDEVGSSAAFVNGYSIGYDGMTFGFHRFQDDVKITIAQASWDDPMDGSGASGMTLDQTKINVFAIQYQYLGAGAIRLLIESDTTGEFVLVHTINYVNDETQPSTHNPNYFFHIHVANLGTTSDIMLKTSSYAYFVEGKTSFYELHQPQFSSEERQRTSVTTEVSILTIRNKSTYASKTNFIDALIEHLGASIEASSANNLGKLRLVKNTNLGGGASVWNDINTNNSVVEIDVVTHTLSDGLELFSLPLAGKNDALSVELLAYKIILAPNETLTLAVTSSNSATVNGSILWKELF